MLDGYIILVIFEIFFIDEREYKGFLKTLSIDQYSRFNMIIWFEILILIKNIK